MPIPSLHATHPDLQFHGLMKYGNEASLPMAGPNCHSHDHPRKNRPTTSPADLERASRIFRALGDAPRLRLLELLRSGECCVTELVDASQEKFSTVSQR